MAVRRRGARPRLAVLLAPWRRAPLLLLRRGSVLAAVLGAAAVLAASASATPLFLSSVGSAALHRQLEKGCLDDSVPYMSAGRFGSNGGGFTLDDGSVSAVESQVRGAVRGVPHVRPTVETMVASQLVGLGTGRVEPFDERLVSRTGFLDHVHLLERAGGSGIYLTDGAARYLGGVHAGDRVTLSLEDRKARVRVAGIYHNLANEDPVQYWCPEQSLIYPPGYGALYTPPMIILADHDAFRSLQRTLRNRTVLAFELPPTSYDLTVEQAREIDTAVREQVAPLLGGTLQGQVFFGDAVTLRPNLGHLIDRSVGTSRAVQDAVGPAAVAGALVALLLVGAAGSYWADRRRQEVRLLAARGVGPAALGLKAALEMGPPAIAGGAAGLVVAYLLVESVGPSGALGAGALRFAVIVAALAVLAGIVLLGAAAAMRARRVDDVARGRGRPGRALARIPWELAALAAAAWAVHRLASAGATHRDVAGIAHVDLLAIAFPLLFLAGAVGLAGRIAYLVLRALRRRGQGGPPAWYLAGRRLAAAPHVALVMLVAAALPIGALVYSSTVTHSVSATLRAKVSTFAGSDVTAELLARQPVPPALAGRATTIARSDDESLGPFVGGLPVDVMGVDRATFAKGAFWVDGLGGGRSLSGLLASLAPGPRGAPLPALLVGVPDWAPSTLTQSDRGARKQVQLRVTARLAAFPGLHGRPLIVVDRAALERLTHDIGYAIWLKGDPTRVLAALRAGGVDPLYVVDRDAVLDASSFLALTWTFGFLEVIAVLTGCIAIGGLLLYLESRTRSRVTSYVLARRMGLRRRAHFGSLTAELGLLLGAGLVIGAGLALLAAWVVHGRLDVAPTLQPRPLMPVPVAAVGTVAAAVAAVAVLGALGAQLSADRVRPAEVMRFDG